jgi:hypothetical protein
MTTTHLKPTITYTGRAKGPTIYREEDQRIRGITALVELDGVLQETGFIKHWNHDTGKIVTDEAVYVPAESGS